MTTAAGATTAATVPAVAHKGLITLSIMLATVMQVLDTTIANVALPSMTGDLGASQDTITWVLTSYIVAAAVMTPVTGWLPQNPALKAARPGAAAGEPASLMKLDQLVNLQALMVANVDDFKLMMVITLAALPMALMLKKARAVATPVALQAD